jgi:hypothetical protein
MVFSSEALLPKIISQRKKTYTELVRFSTAVGAAFGTSKAGIGIAGLGTFKPELIMKVTEGLYAHKDPSLKRPFSLIIISLTRMFARSP